MVECEVEHIMLIDYKMLLLSSNCTSRTSTLCGVTIVYSLVDE